jgi:diaminopimelate epimerase
MSHTINNHYVRLSEVYTANGNKLGVVLLHDEIASTDFRLNHQLRQLLVIWGRQRSVDSIMVVSRPCLQSIATDVFEPWAKDSGKLAGSWSTMCGNGMMAVARFYENNLAMLGQTNSLSVRTRSGTRQVIKLNADHYSVSMGNFTHASRDLSTYVRLGNESKELLTQPIPKNLAIGFTDRWSIGLSGDRIEGVIDGEPHVVLVSPSSEKMSPRSLRRIAIDEGPNITKNPRLFPHEINANFAVVRSTDSPELGLNVLACTHERGLGDSPERSVTGACGTGATAIAATLYHLYRLPDDCPVNITMPAGKLKVYRNTNQYHLVGTVQKGLSDSTFD